LVQGHGGDEFQPAGILKYFEELNRVPNTEIGPKDFLEIASSKKIYDIQPADRYFHDLFACRILKGVII
jgi:hypothetical protein